MAETKTPGASAVTDPGTGAGVRGRSLFAIKGVFTGDYSGVRGALIVLMDPSNNRLERVHAVIVSDKTDYKFTITKDWKTIEDALISAKLHGQVVGEMSKDVQAYIKKVIQDDVADPLSEALRSDNLADVRRLMTDIISKAIADADVLMELAVERVELAEAVSPVAGAAVAEASGADGESQQSVASPTQVRVKVDPILSPVQGIAAKNVTPGMNMIVEMKETAAQKPALARLVSIRTPGSSERGQYEGKILEVQQTDFDRINITMLLATDIIGFTNISGELRVKVSEASLKLAQAYAGGKGPARTAATTGTIPPLPTNIFLWAALGIFIIMLILAYLIFGGVI